MKGGRKEKERKPTYVSCSHVAVIVNEQPHVLQKSHVFVHACAHAHIPWAREQLTVPHPKMGSQALPGVKDDGRTTCKPRRMKIMQLTPDGLVTLSKHS